VCGGGGGTITPADARVMENSGVDRIFFAGTPLTEMLEFVKKTYGPTPKASIPTASRATALTDRRLARLLTAAEIGRSRITRDASPTTRVVGITGPGGAGKTTLIDELVLRFLDTDARGRLAILSHDPSLVGQGPLLGDR